MKLYGEKYGQRFFRPPKKAEAKHGENDEFPAMIAFLVRQFLNGRA
jgi:hypothetical protein